MPDSHPLWVRILGRVGLLTCDGITKAVTRRGPLIIGERAMLVLILAQLRGEELVAYLSLSDHGCSTPR